MPNCKHPTQRQGTWLDKIIHAFQAAIEPDLELTFKESKCECACTECTDDYEEPPQ